MSAGSRMVGKTQKQVSYEEFEQACSSDNYSYPTYEEYIGLREEVRALNDKYDLLIYNSTYNLEEVYNTAANRLKLLENE